MREESWRKTQNTCGAIVRITRQMKKSRSKYPIESRIDPGAFLSRPLLDGSRRYTIFVQPLPSSRLGPWEKALGRFREVLGHTALGTFFLRDPDDGACIALYPLRAGNNASGIGQFSDGAQLEREILGDVAMRDELCRPADVAELEARLGPLTANEVYFPVPYPCLGGSGALSTYDKGDVWVFANILGQTLVSDMVIGRRYCTAERSSGRSRAPAPLNEGTRIPPCPRYPAFASWPQRSRALR